MSDTTIIEGAATSVQDLDRRTAREIVRLNGEIDALKQQVEQLYRVVRRLEAETRDMRR